MQQTRSRLFRKCLLFERTGYVLVASVLLVGCASRSASTLSADVFRQTFSASGDQDKIQLNPALAFVRVTRAGSTAFLALGADRLDGDLNRETYYSAQRETLELLGGRVVSLDTDDEMFRWNTPVAPNWKFFEIEGSRVVKRGVNLLSYQRSIDLQVPYRYGYQESITLRALAANEANPQYLKRHDRDTLVWFEEIVVPEGRGMVAGGALGVRKNLFGLDPKSLSVVYSEQCPYPAACFSIEQWQLAPR